MTATIDRSDGYRAKLKLARNYTARTEFKHANPLFFLHDNEGFMDFFNALYAAFLASDDKENQVEAFKDMYEYVTREHMIAGGSYIHAVFMLASGAVIVPLDPKPVSSSAVQNFRVYVVTAALEYHNFEQAITNVYLDARDRVEKPPALEDFLYHMIVSYKIAVKLEAEEHIKNMVRRPCLRLCTHELINSARCKSDEWKAQCFEKAESYMPTNDEWVRHVHAMGFSATELAKTVPRLQADTKARTVSHVFV